MKILAILLLFVSSAAFAGERRSAVHYLGKGMITHTDGSTDKYLVSVLMKRLPDGKKMIMVRSLGDKFDFNYKLTLVKNEQGIIKINTADAVAYNDTADAAEEVGSDEGNKHKHRHGGWGHSYKIDGNKNVIMHYHSGKGTKVFSHYSFKNNGKNLLINGMVLDRKGDLLHKWVDNVSAIVAF